MNRAEKRRHKKLSGKKAKVSKSGRLPPVTPQSIQQAVQHHAAGDLAEAEKLYRHILQATPAHPVALHFLGVIAHQQGNSAAAEDLIRKAIAVKPDYTEAHNNLGLALGALGKRDEEIASYRAALDLNPDQANAHYNLGNALMAQGKPEEAVASYRNALAVNPDNAETHYNLGAALHGLARLDEALASYNKALALQPDYVEAHSNLGNLLQDMGNTEEAVRHYRKALALRPDYAAAYSNLGNAQKQLGDLQEAANNIRKALSINPDFVDAHNNLGTIYQELGEPDEAIACYQAALTLQPDYAQAFYNIGNIYAETGKPNEAIAKFHKAIALKPDYADAHSNLANLLKLSGDLDAAITSYRTALTLAPGHANAHGNLGNTLQELGQYDEAIACYHTALAINPDDVDARSNLGAALKDVGRYEEAVISLDKALAINPDYGQAHFNRGLALRELGRNEAAFQSHRRAATLNPGIPGIWASMAQSLKSLEFQAIDDSLLADLQHIVEHPNVSLSQIAGPVLSALRCLPAFSQIVDRTTSDAPEPDLSGTQIAAQLSAFPLFLTLISDCVVNDLQIERMLMVLRRALLQDIIAGPTDAACLPFTTALALHCFTNAYVYVESDEDLAGVNRLDQHIAGLLEQDQPVPPLELTVLAAFRPLHSRSYARKLLDRDAGPDVRQLLRRQISEPLEEADLGKTIPVLTPIRNSVSQSVRAQYEESPYPRWIKTNRPHHPRSIESELQKPPLQLDLGPFQAADAPEILIVGCGTGQQSLNTASRFLGARVHAIDLSLSNLAYARRKTRELGVTNIDYAQADIMELGGLEQKFDVIESAGVLHHLADPLAGWRVLAGLLRPHGLMRITLYSEAARQAVVEGRRLIAEEGYTTSPDDIRRCRQDLIARVAGGETQFAGMLQSWEFYSLSECRDLLFPVQEHRFTLPQIEASLAELNLRFLGFEIDDTAILDAFQNANPDATARTSLARWHAFEMDNPDLFRSMYRFWCQKI